MHTSSARQRRPAGHPDIIAEIAKEAGVVVGGELYSDSMGPAGSAGESYIGMMRENVLTIVDALK